MSGVRQERVRYCMPKACLPSWRLLRGSNETQRFSKGRHLKIKVTQHHLFRYRLFKGFSCDIPYVLFLSHELQRERMEISPGKGQGNRNISTTGGPRRKRIWMRHRINRLLRPACYRFHRDCLPLSPEMRARADMCIICLSIMQEIRRRLVTIRGAMRNNLHIHRL